MIENKNKTNPRYKVIMLMYIKSLVFIFLLKLIIKERKKERKKD